MQAQKLLKERIEGALQESFGPRAGVESIGLDRLGLYVEDAPFELAVVVRHAQFALA